MLLNRRPLVPPSLLGWIVALLLPATVLGHDSRVASEMAEAAKRWWVSLSPELQAQSTFPLSETERSNWHYIPRGRKGVSFKTMTVAQRHLAMGLLSTALSAHGLLQATTIMSLEDVLAELEKGSGPTRDGELYFLTLFGEPGDPKGWGWRFEGHHLSLNFTLAGDHDITVTPSFFGANPGEVRSGPRKGLRALQQEEDFGRSLAQRLSSDQMSKARLSGKVPQDVILDPTRKAEPLEPKGLPVGEMTEDQRGLVEAIVTTFVRRYRAELAEEDLRRIREAGLDRIYFAWMGGMEPGEAHYYRVQGPTFILEYDNAQNNANHIHTVWRDFRNDFGEDLLRRHYEEDSHSRP